MPHPDYLMNKSRTETLADSIFAIAMTLLVIGIAVPNIPASEASAVLPGKVAALYPQFLTFLISFFILASFWLGHHRIFRTIKFVDERLLWINILLLFFIVLIPFTTSLSGDYDNVLIAVLLFHLNLLVASFILTLQVFYIKRNYSVLNPGVDENAWNITFHPRNVTLPIVAMIAIGVSFLSPHMSLWCYLLLFVINPVSGYLYSRRARSAGSPAGS